MSTLRVPETVPSPIKDCERLKEAFRGFGTDEKAIIWVLGHRNASQRKKIRDTCCQLYSENLIDALNSELSGDFGKAVILWTSDRPERDARLANDALKTKKKGIKHLQVIVEIACPSTPHHLVAVRQAYFSLFDSSLEEDIASKVSLTLRKILVGLVSSYRYDKDHDDVLYILGTRNTYQLRATFENYKLKYVNPIDKDIKSCGNGDLESLLKMVILCLDCPEKHFAEVSYFPW